ncbi:MAG TPA: SLBB domain-containing protein [Candidatus Kapabacteria bacterium]|nr:SLBB domain-containing protein [Candidatus Kapabacteria bacterium]
MIKKTLTLIAACSTIGFSVWSHPAFAQLTSSEIYSSFQNRIGVADTATEHLMAERQAGRAGSNPQALEAPVDPATYTLGPGDGVYLVVYAMHGLDQDLTVTPEGRLLIPGVGSVPVAGLTIDEAEKKVRTELARDYKSPDVSLSLRHLRPIKVNILGEVLSPGIQTATALERVSEVIDKSGGFKSNSSLRNIEIRTPTGALRAHADLFRYYALGDLAANPPVEAGDVIIVPVAKQYVLVSGSVAMPQRMEFVEGDSLSTALALCQGLLPGSEPDSIEIARFSPSDPVHAQWFWFDLAKGENPLLRDGDQIFIRAFSQYHVPRLVGIGGEVPFPGTYPMEPGKTRIKDIIDQAGGILPDASLSQAMLIRRTGLLNEWENDPEFVRIKTVEPYMKEGLSEEEYTYLTARIDQYRSNMVVDFKKLMSGDESQNLLLREQDSIYIPRALGYVSVSGSVNDQGNVEFIEGGSWKDYIEKAGGFSENADPSALRIVDPNSGSYIDPRSNSDYRIIPGDMIIVPRYESHFWKDVDTITAVTAQILTIASVILLLVKNKL